MRTVCLSGISLLSPRPGTHYNRAHLHPSWSGTDVNLVVVPPDSIQYLCWMQRAPLAALNILYKNVNSLVLVESAASWPARDCLSTWLFYSFQLNCAAGWCWTVNITHISVCRMPSQAASGGVFFAESKCKYADWKAPARGVKKYIYSNKQINKLINKPVAKSC